MNFIKKKLSKVQNGTPFIIQFIRVYGTQVEDEFEGNEAEEEEEEEEKLEAELARELGPPLLSSLQDDATLEAIVPWTTRLPNNILSDIGVVLVRSNLWPGAFTFANKGGR